MSGTTLYYAATKYPPSHGRWQQKENNPITHLLTTNRTIRGTLDQPMAQNMRPLGIYPHQIASNLVIGGASITPCTNPPTPTRPTRSTFIAKLLAHLFYTTCPSACLLPRPFDIHINMMSPSSPTTTIPTNRQSYSSNVFFFFSLCTLMIILFTASALLSNVSPYTSIGAVK